MAGGPRTPSMPERAARSAEKPAEEQLDHLTGARCLASVWIVCGHFAPRLEVTAFTPARHRGNAAVNFFIVMSGFITHWVYASRVMQPGMSQVQRFYARRIGRVVLTTWVAMVLGLCVLLVQLRGHSPDMGHVLRCFLFVETWRDPVDWCPNGQTWTVAALLPCWLLYPATCRVVLAVERLGGAAALAMLAVVLWLLSFGPQLVLFCRQSYWITNTQGVWSYVWPPSQLADFALGSVVAALARRHAASGKAAVEGEEPYPTEVDQEPSQKPLSDGARGTLADSCMVLVCSTCLCAPSSGAREGWEPLFNHGFALVFAIFLYGSAAGGGAGLASKLLRHDALVGLGAYSFEVYLFQYPVHEIFVAIGDISGAYDMRNPAGEYNNNSCGFVVFFFFLWLGAGLYAEFVESRLVSWLRTVTETPARTEGPVSAGPTYEQLHAVPEIEQGDSGIPLVSGGVAPL